VTDSDTAGYISEYKKGDIAAIRSAAATEEIENITATASARAEAVNALYERYIKSESGALYTDGERETFKRHYLSGLEDIGEAESAESVASLQRSALKRLKSVPFLALGVVAIAKIYLPEAFLAAFLPLLFRKKEGKRGEKSED